MTSYVKPGVTYFDLNFHEVDVKLISQLMERLGEQLGRENCGSIGVTPQSPEGHCVLAFGALATADHFEKLYAEATGQRPERLTQPPAWSLNRDGVVVLTTINAPSHVMAPPTDPRSKAPLN